VRRVRDAGHAPGDQGEHRATAGTEGTEDLKKEIQEYVKTHTAPYKYPRIVVFRDELPKTISGKIMRRLL
jgi:acetyl-CoA synthetase